MIKTTVKRRLVNPHKKRKTAAKKTNSGHRRAKRSARKNPGQLITLGFLNPQKRRTTVKKTRKRKHARRAIAKKANPFKFRARAKRHSFRRRRNPGIIGRSTGILKTGLIVLIGLVLTRQIPQMVLKSKNTGWVGYLANAVTAFLASTAASKFMGKETGQYVAIGGAAYLTNRVLTEKFSPIGQMLSLAGVGDYAATGSLGEVVPKYSPTPVDYGEDGTPAYNPYLLEAARAGMAPAAAAAPSGATMGSFGRAWGR